jgi:hypothetical protein
MQAGTRRSKRSDANGSKRVVNEPVESTAPEPVCYNLNEDHALLVYTELV